MKIDCEYLKLNPETVLQVPIDWQPENLVINGEAVYWSVPAQGQLTFQAVGDIIHMQGRLEGKLRVSCSRCLKEFDFPLQSSFAVDLIQGEPDEDTGEAYIIEGNEVDLEPILMEQILFNLPLGLTCNTDCKGLCPVCGQDLNVKACHCRSKQTDPRWDALKKLMEGKEG
ncbi:MAG: YceD family protein [Methylocystaceae bacterium]